MGVFSDLLKIDPNDLTVYHPNAEKIHDMINSRTERFKNMSKKAIEIDDWWFEFTIWPTILERLMEGKSAFFGPTYWYKIIMTKKVKEGGVPGLQILDVSIFDCELRSIAVLRMTLLLLLLLLFLFLLLLFLGWIFIS